MSANNLKNQNTFASWELSMTSQEADFFRNLIFEKSGIFIDSSKVTLLEGRINKRLSKLNLSSYTDYIDF
jgi:chemotaxis protein methyltransferase CheR